MRETTQDEMHKGEWLQRMYVGEKYTWTVSGVLWNNVKERCTVGGATQTREPTYVGCQNKFSGYQAFVEWHRKQIGYGLGYQLDADILNSGTKCYSEDTCLLIPPALNKFLQTYAGKRGKWPQGVYQSGNGLSVSISYKGDSRYLGRFRYEQVDAAKELYRLAKNDAGADWVNRLEAGELVIDPRVIEHMRNWRHICDWKAA